MPKDITSDSLPEPAPRARIPLSKPLSHPRFRLLWGANLLSNVGTWTQAFASAWLIASLSHSPSTITLVQTATYLPIFLFALIAGAAADSVERPKFLFLCNLFLALCASAMAILVMSGHASAAPVLFLTFCMGSGSAFMWPAWQASMSALVREDEVEAAATLNNLSYNVAAVIGPALGGFLFHWIGPGALFMANALSFLALLGAYWSWWRSGAQPARPQTPYWRTLKLGIDAAFGSRGYRRILLKAGTVFFATIAFPSLLPAYVRDVLQRDSGMFGTLMGSLGAGAVVGALSVSHLRARFDRAQLLRAALLVYGAMLIAMALLSARAPVAVLVALVVAGGTAWSTIISTLNAAAQSSFPPEIRARTLSIYLLAMAGAYTAGSAAWGNLADGVGVAGALLAAGLYLLAVALPRLRA
ncbi:MAG: MFS transporter [Pseudomonadota bacterium]